MSAEKIIQQIKKDSDKEIKQIKSEAEKEAKIIFETAKKEIELQANKTFEQGKMQSENLKKILVSKANQDIKRDIMNEKEKIIEECFTKAHHELSILKGQRYEKLVKKLILDGKEKLGGNCSIFITKDADSKIAEDLNIKIFGKIESAGGVILVSPDGRVKLDHTFDGTLKREKDKLRIKVGKLLFS